MRAGRLMSRGEMNRHRPVFRRRRNTARTLWRAAFLTLLTFGLLVACTGSSAAGKPGRSCSDPLNLPGSEAEVSPREFHAMIHRGEFAEVDRLFDGIQREIEQGKRTHWDACRVYSPFGTTDPAVAADIERWLTANPDSIHAHLARGAHRHHLASIIRNTGTIDKVSQPQMRQYRDFDRQAAEDFAWVLERKPNMSTASQYLMGMALSHGNGAAIDRIFEEANKASPGSGPLHYDYIATFLPWWRSEPESGVLYRVKRLLDDFHTQYAGNPEFNWLKSYLAEFQASLLMRERKYAAAAEYYTKAMKQFEWPRADLYLRRAEALLGAKRKDEALLDIARAEEADGQRQRPCGLGLYGKLYREVGMTEKALAEYAARLACDPLHPGVLYEHALLLSVTGQREEARADVEKMLVYGAASPEYQVNRGWVLMRLDKNAADAAYREAIKLSAGRFHFVDRYMDFLRATRSCRSLELVPLYLESCARNGECKQSKTVLEASLRRTVIGPCGAEAGPPAKKPLPLPSDPIPG